MKWTQETKQIEVPAFRDGDGNPCCAGDFSNGEVCPFYRTQRFGCHETCVFADDNGKYMEGMKRRDDGRGSLVPLKTCPIWKNI